MENQLNLFQKLLKIQQKIVGLGKDKSTYNYKYVTGDKVLGEIKPLMNEYGILLKQEVISIENSRQDYQLIDKDKNVKNKSEILSKLMMKFTWVDANTGEKDENLFGANGQNDWEKGLGSALTYAERYFLLKYFHIATDEDDIDNDKRKDDIDNGKGKMKNPALTEVLFNKAITRIKDKEEGVLEKIKAAFEISPDYLTLLIDAEKQTI